MFQYKNLDNYIYYLILFFPISIILGDLFLNLNSVLISIMFLIFLYKFKELKLINNKYYYPFYCLLLLFFISTVFSDYFIESAENLLSFFSQLTLFACLVYFLNKNKKYTLKLSKIIFIIVALICIDLWIQKLFGKNIFGYEQQQAGRLTSFFKEEQIPGGILFKLSPLIIYYLFNLNNNIFIYKYKYIFLIMLYFSILITGERLPSILSTMALIIILLFNVKKINKKELIIYSIIFSLVFIFFFFQEDSIIRERYNYTFKQFDGNVYFKFYVNTLNIFKENYLFGTGLQTYRYECSEIFTTCSTHPHNFFFELLSDTGIFSAFLFYFSLTYILVIKLKKNNSSLNKSLIISYTILLFFPLLPSGSFFSSFAMNITWFSLGFVYSLSENV